MTLRRPTLSFCRWLMLAAVALSLVLQPVLASIGELHALTHDAAAAHDDNMATGSTEEEGAGTLHVIHHLAHCCGHVVEFPIAPVMAIAISHNEPVDLLDIPPVAGGRWLAPFRPPIAG